MAESLAHRQAQIWPVRESRFSCSDRNRRRPAWEAGILPLNYSRSMIRSKYGRIIGSQTSANLASPRIQILMFRSEPATSSLGSWHSTTELLPLDDSL